MNSDIMLTQEREGVGKSGLRGMNQNKIIQMRDGFKEIMVMIFPVGVWAFQPRPGKRSEPFWEQELRARILLPESDP